MEQVIKDKLLKLEQKHNITILLAVESGSRVWGFNSSNSDYDIRFIYKHDLKHYLTLNEGTDNITKMNKELNLDFIGRDLKKYLSLVFKGSAQASEWAYSPIVYQGVPGAQEDLQNLATAFYSQITAFHHHLHFAESEYLKHIRLDVMVSIKKYLYVIRSLLCCKYIELFNNIPPVNMKDLLLLTESTLDVQIVHEINSLIIRKSNNSERTEILPNQHLNRWIESQIELNQILAATLTRRNKPDIKILNDYLYSKIKES